MSSYWRPLPKTWETGEAHPPSDAGLRHIRRRAQIDRPDRRRNRYPLLSAEGFFNAICAFRPKTRVASGPTPAICSPIQSGIKLGSHR